MAFVYFLAKRARRALLALAALCSMLGPAIALTAPASGYWWNPAEPGRGFVIETQGSTLFMAGFLYDVSGRSTWVGSLGAMSSPTQYSGSIITYTGGQTLTGAFKPSTVSPSLGPISISFTSNTQGTLTWPGGAIPIQRFDIVPGGSAATQPAGNPQTGWWWNSSEGGRGFAIEVQGNQMYLAGYMYDAAGNPVWYLTYGAMTGTSTYTGVWQQFGNGQTMNGAFKPSAVVNANAGSVTIQFSSPTAAMLTLPDGRQIAFTRFTFGVSGPTLSAFSPATAAPTSLLAITGSGIDTTATLALNMFDDAGYNVSIPFASATSTSLKASVPPYIVAASGAFASASVKMKLTQTSGGTTTNSNTLTGFTIQKLAALPGTAGTSTLSLMRANLAEAQRLQTAIHGTAQDTPAVNAALTRQVSNLQSLVTSVQDVVQHGNSFALGVVGGVSITVTQANIGDVDSLILATVQSLASPSGGSSLKGTDAAPPSCMSAEALAFYNGMLTGAANLDALAQALVSAPGSSAACNTADAFGAAYQIFGGAGGLGLGLTNGTGINALRLAGAALFALASQNAEGSIGLNALISPLLAAQLAAIQSAISGVTSLSQATSDALLARSSGPIADNLADSRNLLVTVAPTLPSGFPTNLPTGNYSVTYSFCITIPGQANQCSSGGDGVTLTNADASDIASTLVSIFTQACA